MQSPNASPDSSHAGQGWRSILPGVLVSLVLLAVIFYFVDFRKFLSALQHANYGLVALGLIISVIWLAVRGIFWRTLLRKRASYPQVFWTLTEGYLLNNFLPFRLGEVGRSFLLSRKAGMGFWEVLPTIVIERVLDVLMAAVIFLSAVPFVVGGQANIRFVGLMGVVMLSGLAVFYLLARYNAWAIAMFEKLSGRFPLLKKLGGGILPAFLSGLGVLTDTRLFLSAIFWLLLNWAISILQFFVMLLAFFPSPRLFWVFFTLGAAAFGNAVPSAPGSLGAYEAAAVGAMKLLNLNLDSALAFALTTHLLSYVVNGLLGAIALSREGQTISALVRELRQVGQAPKDPSTGSS